MSGDLGLSSGTNVDVEAASCPNEEQTYKLTAKSENGSEILSMKIKSGTVPGQSSSKVGSYQDTIELTTPDFERSKWLEESSYEFPGQPRTPSNNEMRKLRQKYRPKLEEASSEAQEEEVLEQMWEEAAEIELDEIERSV